ncbi:MAG TPA: hypothetical protein VII55_00105 [Candidatus Saccharimonadales bacterium]
MTAGAEVLTRKQAMHEVVGPVLTVSMAPIYSGQFDDQEQAEIPKIEDTRDLQLFSVAAVAILSRRYLEHPLPNDQMEKINEINEAIGLFHRVKLEDAIDEGRRTGVMVPLGVASHIAILEASPDNKEKFDPHRFNRSRVFPLDAQELTTIMDRPTFDEIILTLAKGHNGTLGELTTSLALRDPYFFSFHRQNGSRLLIPDAYEFDVDEIVGLSSEFRLSAAATRHKRVELLQEDSETSDAKGLMAGCPVRYGFEDEKQGMVEALILTGKGFLMDALKTAQGKEPREAISS